MVAEIELQVLDFIKIQPNCSSKDIYEFLAGSISYATTKRHLNKLVLKNLIVTNGKGKGTKYVISPAFGLLQPLDVVEYFEKEIDERTIRASFNEKIISELTIVNTIFTDAERLKLEALHKIYKQNVEQLTQSEYLKELERLAIDLSWKSSQIEGNTYSLLETERLLKDKQTASGKTKDEAIMLLNHKAAIDFIIEQPDYLSPLLVSKIEDIHSMLIKELGIDRNIRNKRIGISGTNYRPLENQFQIYEALESMCTLINSKSNVF